MKPPAPTKRPIAELLTLTLREDAAAERTQCDREMWQILSRKQGYVTHRVYRRLDSPQVWLAYSEWEAKKLLDGARQQLQGTPLSRRAQATLTAPPQRLIVELIGTLTSTKGLDLSAGAVVVVSSGSLAEPQPTLRACEDAFWKPLAAQPGYLTHVLFRGWSDPLQLGAASHWESQAACEAALAALAPAPEAEALGRLLAAPLQHTVYAPLRL